MLSIDYHFQKNTKNIAFLGKRTITNSPQKKIYLSNFRIYGIIALKVRVNEL
jgi:hypothetical protein